jgi:GntR family transcriptional regulator, carbon starvation induced regulator
MFVKTGFAETLRSGAGYRGETLIYGRAMLGIVAMEHRAAKSNVLGQHASAHAERAFDVGAGGELGELIGRLREDIVNARYHADEPLRFRTLAVAYGASVSTLREALARLAGESLVEFRPNHGFRVATISVEDLVDIIDTRGEIESVALRQSIEAGDDHWEAEIVAAHHRLTRVQSRLKKSGDHAMAVEWEIRHREFHQALIAACRSRWLMRFCETLRIQCDRYRHLVLVPPSTYPRLVAHHKPMMDAALARNADEACLLLATHFAESSRMILAHIGQRAGGAQRQRAGVHRGAVA